MAWRLLLLTLAAARLPQPATAPPTDPDDDPSESVPAYECRCSALDVEVDHDYAGSDIGGERHGLKTMQDCCMVCAKTPGCVWFQHGYGPAGECHPPLLRCVRART
jgi:hypothetical protein